MEYTFMLWNLKKINKTPPTSEQLTSKLQLHPFLLKQFNSKPKPIKPYKKVFYVTFPSYQKSLQTPSVFPYVLSELLSQEKRLHQLQRKLYSCQFQTEVLKRHKTISGFTPNNQICEGIRHQFSLSKFLLKNLPCYTPYQS